MTATEGIFWNNIQGYIFWPFPKVTKVKTGKNLKEDLKTGREKGEKEKRKRMIKHTLKYLYEA